jgi:hypothetical protein
MNRFRRLLVRWEKKPENDLAVLPIDRAFFAFRAAGILVEVLNHVWHQFVMD